MNEHDLISKTALLRHLDMAMECKDCPRNTNRKTYYERCACSEVADICNTITDFATFADVQPVKRGMWIPQGDDMWLCSNCKENIIFSMHESDRTEKQRYCCRCGARMNLEEESE